MSKLKKIKDKMIITKKIVKISESMLLSSKMKLVSTRHKMNLFKERVKMLGNMAHYVLNKNNNTLLYNMGINLYKYIFYKKCDYNCSCQYKNNNKMLEEIRFFFFSDIGFCGQYNSNLFKMYSNCHVRPIVIGKKGDNCKEFIGSSDEFNKFNLLKDDFNIKKKSNEFSKFKLSGDNLNISFSVVNAEKSCNIIVKLCDFILPDKTDSVFEIPDNLFYSLANNFLQYCYYLSKYNETFYRIKTMTNAVDNANEEAKKLKVNFSKERQSLITQEIALIASNAGNF